MSEQQGARRHVIREWTAHGLPCTISWGRAGFNGYVQLPQGHIDRELGQAAGTVVTQEAGAQGFPLGHWHGYDVLGHLRAPGGLTYGPDEDGLVGFDCAHSDDDWADEEIAKYLLPDHESAWQEFRATQEHMATVGHEWPIGRETAKLVGPDEVHSWTMEELVAAVEDLARQVSEVEAKIRG